jgi:hypothetical protein
MKTGLLIFLLILAYTAVHLLVIRKDAKRPLPKNLPPPLKDEDEEDSR